MATWAIRTLFEELARDRPLIVVLEDLNWAEPTFLDLIEYIAGFSRGGRSCSWAARGPNC